MSNRLNRVLIVEDDAFNARLLEAMLAQTLECDVLVTDRGSDALALLRVEKPKIDLLLLDLHLPEMSGEEILKAVRQMEPYRDMPILIVSVDGLDEKKYLDMGADGFVLKPYHPDKLMQQISACFKEE